MGKAKQIVQGLKEKYGIRENGTYSPEVVVTLRELDKHILKEFRKTDNEVEGMGEEKTLSDILMDYEFTYWSYEMGSKYSMIVEFETIGKYRGFDTKVFIKKIELFSYDD